MSMIALKWAREPRPTLGGPATAVLRDLADRASDSGVCWPSIATIAADTGFSERTVQRSLRRLESEKLITIRLTGRGSRYTLNVPSVTSEVSESHLRGDTLTPKASRSRRLRARAREDEPRQNAGAYGKVVDALPNVVVDPDVLKLAKDWLQ